MRRYMTYMAWDTDMSSTDGGWEDTGDVTAEDHESAARARVEKLAMPHEYSSILVSDGHTVRLFKIDAPVAFTLVPVVSLAGGA